MWHKKKTREFGNNMNALVDNLLDKIIDKGRGKKNRAASYHSVVDS